MPCAGTVNKAQEQGPYFYPFTCHACACESVPTEGTLTAITSGCKAHKCQNPLSPCIGVGMIELLILVQMEGAATPSSAAAPQVDSLIEGGLSTGNAPEAAQGFAMVKTTEDAQQFAKATAAQLSTGAVLCLYMSPRRCLACLSWKCCFHCLW